jgi:hypothetical protein
MFLVDYLYSHHKLWDATRIGNVKAFTKYFAICRTVSKLNHVRHNTTPLKNAIMQGSLEMARALLSAGCDPHLTEPLLYVVTYGMTDFLELFIEFRIDLCQIYSHDNTALIVASFYSQFDVVNRLLPYYTPSQIRLRDEDGMNCLMMAMMLDNDDIVKRIIEMCPEIVGDTDYDLTDPYEFAHKCGAIHSLNVLKTMPQQIDTTSLMISQYF